LGSSGYWDIVLNDECGHEINARVLAWASIELFLHKSITVVVPSIECRCSCFVHAEIHHCPAFVRGHDDSSAPSFVTWIRKRARDSTTVGWSSCGYRCEKANHNENWGRHPGDELTQLQNLNKIKEYTILIYICSCPDDTFLDPKELCRNLDDTLYHR
jgi:hypothetical protein